MSLLDELKNLERDCLAKLRAGARDPLLRCAVTFCQRAQRSIRFGKTASAEFDGFLSSQELRALASWLPAPLAEIAARAASHAVCVPNLAFFPVLPWLHKQKWRVNDVDFNPPERGAQGAYHAMYLALTAPGDPFEIAPFLKPHTQRFDEEGLRTQAVALHNGIERARRQIQVLAPPLAHALEFECSRKGTFRYVGTDRIHAPTPDVIAQLPSLGKPPPRPRAVNFSMCQDDHPYPDNL